MTERHKTTCRESVCFKYKTLARQENRLLGSDSKTRTCAKKTCEAHPRAAEPGLDSFDAASETATALATAFSDEQKPRS